MGGLRIGKRGGLRLGKRGRVKREEKVRDMVG